MSAPAETAPVAAVEAVEAVAVGVNEEGQKGFWTKSGEFFKDDIPHFFASTTPQFFTKGSGNPVNWFKDSYKLVYFNLRGLAEPTRTMFALSKTEYEDVRLSIDLATWSRPEFDAMQAKGDFDCNMGGVPVLVYNGRSIGQSKSIERFVAGKLGFNGSNAVEAARIDNLCENVRDLSDNYNQAVAGKKDAELEAAKAAYAATLKGYCSALEKCVDGPFAVGSKMSLADIVLQWIFTDIFSGRHQLAEATEAALADCPKLKAINASVADACKAYFESRPVTKF